MSLTYLQNRHNGFDSGWTQERIEFLKQWWAEGWSASQIASKFHGVFTRCSVIGKARRLKLKPRAARQLRKINGVPKPPMPPPRPQPPRPPLPQPTAPRMRALTFFRLKPHHCHWPIGEWYEPARLFCGADKELGEIYCPFHLRMARSAGDA
jgi:hypothetical protein